MSAPPVNIPAIDMATREVMAMGHRIFQTHRYHSDDREQVGMLLDLLAPSFGAAVLDAGCGIGEVARLMHEARPDLVFILANLSEYQLSMCPVGDQFIHLQGNCCALGLPDRTVEAVMFSSSLCQMDTGPALAEAYRLLTPGGTLLINDMVRTGGDGQLMENALAARVLTHQELLAHVLAAGFQADHVMSFYPSADDSHFRGMLDVCDLGFLADHIDPILIRATKNAHDV